MRFNPRQSGWGIGELRAYLRWPALLLLLSLTAHSFDACAVHFGLADGHSSSVESRDCSRSCTPQKVCIGCHHTDHPPDICQVISEVSTLAAHGFRMDAPAVTSVAAFARPSELFVLTPPVEAPRSRDGPDAPSLASLCLRSTLPGRSPPLSA